MCLVLVALLLVAISQNLGMRDRLKQMESRLDWMAEALRARKSSL
jgi:hypothetical protein